MILKDLLIGAALVGGTFVGVAAAASALQGGDGNAATFQQVSSRARLVGGGTPPLTSGLLAGRPVETVGDAPLQRRPIAVMVDNNSAAAQMGLNRADVVIEALVEGGITRFLAVFHSQEAPRIEPVRSARTPFLRWALEYDALFSHVGSSEETGDADAGRQIIEWKVADLDYQGAKPVPGDTFARDSAREAPHNVYTSTANLRRAAESRAYNRAPTFQPWTFELKPSASSTVRLPATRITVGFGSLSPFTVGWTWDASTRLYRRSQYGTAHLDASTNEQLTASNVIVQYARSYVADGVGHVLIDNIGQGRAQLFMDGTVIDATWRKADNASRTRFYSPTGLEIGFRPGATWIEVVDVSGGVRIE